MPICYGGENGGGNEPNDDEQTAGDSSFSFREPMGFEDLVQERRDTVKEPHVDTERDKDEPEFKGS